MNSKFGPGYLLPAVVLVLSLFTLLSALFAQPTSSAEVPQRIISLAPSTTEILFRLDLGDKVVGVTRFCDYPPEARTITKVGGYVDPNYEEILSLRPDLVILLTSHANARRELGKLGVPILMVPHQTIKNINEAVRLIGERCGAKPQAEALLTDIDRRFSSIRQAVAGRERPRVLVCIRRDVRLDRLGEMYMVGEDGFYNGIIEAAGGTNGLSSPVPFPRLSEEGVIDIDPEVIIDLVEPGRDGGRTPAEIARQWDQLPFVSAVRDHRVYVLIGYHALRPGPRYILFLEELARLLHPGVFKKDGVDD